MHRTFQHHQHNLLLRSMSFDDLDVVLPIEQTSHSHPWSQGNFESSLQSSHQCVVLEKQGGIIAYVITSTACDEAELLNITVANNYRQQGIGGLLLDAVCQSFSDTITSLFLEVRASNRGAVALYNSKGFNEVGIRANYYPHSAGHREDAIIMAKVLGV